MLHGVTRVAPRAPRAPGRRGFVLRTVDFDDPVAVALRDAMGTEMRLRYWLPAPSGPDLPPGMPVTAEQAVWTGVAEDADGYPLGHVTLRRVSLAGERDTVEIKRMYVVPSHRGAGVAGLLLAAVDDAARSLGARRVVLQTGARQPDAIRLYTGAGFRPIPVFPPYEALAHSRCFAKTLTPAHGTDPVVRRG